MSEEIQKPYQAKISAEFALFEMRKKMIEYRDNPDILKEINLEKKIRDLAEAEEEIKKHLQLSNSEIIVLYRTYAASLRYEIREGLFKEHKKCGYCAHFLGVDLSGKKKSPCRKMNAWAKMFNSHPSEITSEDKEKFDRWHLYCKDTYVPAMDECDVQNELQMLEKERKDLIDEWEAVSIEALIFLTGSR